MFKILSDLSLVLRKDIPVADTNNNVLASGVSGSWITYNGTNAKLTAGATELAWPVWNESRRDTTVGWTPDVTNSKKVTALCGKFFATTNQYTGSPVVTSPLVTAAGGVLAVGTEGTSTNVVAYCTKSPYQINFHGTTVTVIDIYVL